MDILCQKIALSLLKYMLTILGSMFNIESRACKIVEVLIFLAAEIADYTTLICASNFCGQSLVNRCNKIPGL